MKKHAITAVLCFVAGFAFLVGCGGVDNSDSITTWLIDVGDDFEDSAQCVAAEMKAYTASDFQQSFDGAVNEPFETDLDAAYALCDDRLGVTSGEYTPVPRMTPVPSP